MPKFLPNFLERIKQRIVQEIPGAGGPGSPGAVDPNAPPGMALEPPADAPLDQSFLDRLKNKIVGPRERPLDEVNRGPPTRPAIMYRLREAGRRQVLVYLKYEGSIGRFVEPYSFRYRAADPKENPLFFGYCRAHNVISAFKISKIEDVRVTDVPFRPQWTVELS